MRYESNFRAINLSGCVFAEITKCKTEKAKSNTFLFHKQMVYSMFVSFLWRDFKKFVLFLLFQDVHKWLWQKGELLKWTQVVFACRPNRDDPANWNNLLSFVLWQRIWKKLRCFYVNLLNSVTGHVTWPNLISRSSMAKYEAVPVPSSYT